MASANQSDNFVCKCEGKDGYPVANVTWYNSSGVIVTGKENAILSLSNVSKDNSGMYRCEAKSSERAKNETSIQLIVNCKFSTGMPEPRVQRVQLHPLPFLFATLWVHHGCTLHHRDYKRIEGAV